MMIYLQILQRVDIFLVGHQGLTLYIEGALVEITDPKADTFDYSFWGGTSQESANKLSVNDLRGTHSGLDGDVGRVEVKCCATPGTDPLRAIYAVAQSKDVANTAVLDGVAVTRTVQVFKVTTSGVSDVTGSATCASDRPDALVGFAHAERYLEERCERFRTRAWADPMQAVLDQVPSDSMITMPDSKTRSMPNVFS